jgi:hypothetical protein
MLPMLIVKRRMNIIKQPGKRDNVRQKTPNILQLSKNSSSRNVIKIIFDINLHHDSIRVLVEGDSNAKKDGLIASNGRYFELMGG